MSYRSSSKIVAIDQFWKSYAPWTNYQFSGLFFSLFTDIYLIFGTLLCHTKIQIKFEFDFDPLIFPLDLNKYHKLSVFRTFFLSAYSYSFDIRYIALPYQDTDQVWIWFWSIDFSRSYSPWTSKNITNYQFSGPFFFLLTDIHLILGALLCHTIIQIKFEFGFDP
jgi:hypothetical protein